MQLLKTFILFLLLLVVCSDLIAQNEVKEKNTNEVELNVPPIKIPPPSVLDSLNRLKGISEYNFKTFLDKSALYEYNYGSEQKFKFYLPKDTSYYMRRAVLLHMANNKEAKEWGKEYVKMYINIVPEEFRNELGNIKPAVIYSGTLDPVEAFRNYKRRQRQKRVMEVIAKFTAMDRKDTIRQDSIWILKEKAE
ncbi:MAG: hypothetical protein ACRDD8_07570 [Bacteroidales bacterium]